MFRELIIKTYLLLFQWLFLLFSKKPLEKNKIVFVNSFGDNCSFLLEEIEKRKPNIKVILLQKKGAFCTIPKHLNVKMYRFETYHLLDTFLSVYHLATAQRIIVDNYFGFLSAVKFKENVKCIQIWHAAGAIKKFGLEDPSNQNRTLAANRRFQQVYDNFDYVVVGSEKFAEVFKKAFGIEDSKILATGIPRTDLFFNPEIKNKKIELLRSNWPFLQDKMVILYAPTFRSEEMDSFQIKLDLQKLVTSLSDKKYHLLIKLHPINRNHISIPSEFKSFITDVSTYPNINDLLLITNLLITDYSSIPFEFSILEKPMIFFAYDLEQYEKERGFWEPYHELVPGPIANNTDEIIELIHANKFDLDKIKTFKETWNKYSFGESSKNFVREILRIEE